MGTAPPAWIAITLMLCATASCSSRATRIRSLVTAAAASRMRRRSTSTPLLPFLESVSRPALPLTRRPTVHGSDDAAQQRRHDPLGVEDGRMQGARLRTQASSRPASA